MNPDGIPLRVSPHIQRKLGDLANGFVGTKGRGEEDAFRIHRKLSVYLNNINPPTRLAEALRLFGNVSFHLIHLWG